MRAYAIEVTQALTGPMVDGMLICPLTGNPFSITDGQVDKSDPREGYRPGYIVMVSIIGNYERSNLQKAYRDLPYATEYMADVAMASDAAIEILAPSVAYANKEAYAGREIAKGENTGADIHSRNVLNGPYGM